MTTAGFIALAAIVVGGLAACFYIVRMARPTLKDRD